MDSSGSGAKADLAEFARRAEEDLTVDMSPRTVIYRRGGPASGLYVLQEGIAILHESSHGREDFVYEILAPGSVFGEECLASSGVYSTNATAVTGGRIRMIPAEKLRRQFSEDAAGRQWVLDSMAQRRRRQDLRLRSMCSLGVAGRILETIADLSRWFPGRDGLEADLPLSQSMMARMVCSTRETVSSQLNRLADVQLVRLSPRHIGVPSVAALLEARRQLEED
jgi:CRP-like cAMP-binding protein